MGYNGTIQEIRVAPRVRDRETAPEVLFSAQRWWWSSNGPAGVSVDTEMTRSTTKTETDASSLKATRAPGLTTRSKKLLGWWTRCGRGRRDFDFRRDGNGRRSLAVSLERYGRWKPSTQYSDRNLSHDQLSSFHHKDFAFGVFLAWEKGTLWKARPALSHCRHWVSRSYAQPQLLRHILILGSELRSLFSRSTNLNIGELFFEKMRFATFTSRLPDLHPSRKLPPERRSRPVHVAPVRVGWVVGWVIRFGSPGEALGGPVAKCGAGEGEGDRGPGAMAEMSSNRVGDSQMLAHHLFRLFLPRRRRHDDGRATTRRQGTMAVQPSAKAATRCDAVRRWSQAASGHRLPGRRWRNWWALTGGMGRGMGGRQWKSFRVGNLSAWDTNASRIVVSIRCSALDTKWPRTGMGMSGSRDDLIAFLNANSSHEWRQKRGRADGLGHYLKSIEYAYAYALQWGHEPPILLWRGVSCASQVICCHTAWRTGICGAAGGNLALAELSILHLSVTQPFVPDIGRERPL